MMHEHEIVNLSHYRTSAVEEVEQVCEFPGKFPLQSCNLPLTELSALVV